MAEVIIPELIADTAAVDVGVGAAAADVAAEGAIAGGVAEAGAGVADVAAGAGGVDAATGAAIVDTIGTGVFETGSNALDALGGYGFDAPVSSADVAGAGSGAGAVDTSAAAATQGGFVPASATNELDMAAINALNEPTLASPEISNVADTTNLGSVTSEVPTTESPIAAQPSTDVGPTETTGASQGPTQQTTDIADTTNPTDQTPPPAEQPQQGQRGTSRGAKQAASAGSSGGFDPLKALGGLGQLAAAGNKPSSPYLGQGAGYASSLGDFGTQQINQYNSGQLRPADFATIMTQQKAALNKMRQFYASSGNSNSTAEAQAENQIMQQSVAQTKQFFDQYAQTGMKALGDASGQLITAARTDLSAQQAYNSALSSAIGSATRAFSGLGSQFSGGNTGENSAAGTGSDTNFQQISTGGGGGGDIIDSGGGVDLGDF